MSSDVAHLFESELRSRGLPFSIDAESGRHAVEIGGGSMLVSLDNLNRNYQSDGDASRVTRFVDAIVAAADDSPRDYATDRVYWSLEPNDYDPKPDVSVPVSDRVDRVLIHESGDGRLLTWVTAGILKSLHMSEQEASETAFANLQRELAASEIEFDDIVGTRLGYVNTPLQFKASLILAPNLKEVASPILGWPLLAVVPDRNFLYLWDAGDRQLVNRLGEVVVREYSEASYPLSTEVYEMSDNGVRTIGAFPVV